MTKRKNKGATAAATATAIEAVTALLQSPEAWCQKAGARNAAGEPVPAESPQACSWCLRGAIARVGGGEAVADHLVSVLQTKFNRPGLIELAQFNDGRFTTHADVLELLHAACQGCRPDKLDP